jgi:hypothetical protein
MSSTNLQQGKLAPKTDRQSLEFASIREMVSGDFAAGVYFFVTQRRESLKACIVSRPRRKKKEGSSLSSCSSCQKTKTARPESRAGGVNDCDPQQINLSAASNRINCRPVS